MITPADVLVAQRRIAPWVRETPVIRWDEHPSRPIVKLEALQVTGSFKARGAFNRVLAAQEVGAIGEAGVIGASGGNAGLALAYAAHRLGIHAEIVVPETSSPVKLERLRTLGATVVVHGQRYGDAYDFALARQQVSGALFVHAYDQEEVVAGQGTAGLEFLDQAGGLDVVVVAAGGGGLVAGIRLAMPEHTRVIAVEPTLAPTIRRAIEAGGPVDVEVAGVAADSLGARRCGDLAYHLLSSMGVESVLVDEEEMIVARQRLWDEFRLVGEYGGVAALAALLAGKIETNENDRLGIIFCGANSDPSDLVKQVSNDQG
ncbi:threonine/serine dehydratase [Ferrimicrobium acidiphilum]|uniref:Phenylserine dehydratase n=1 Tax=Ferrimicrobium acidiphilum DSM 19497 TaxID=1121877 RepID=A0A0D8FXN4_9ACTN|nr:threonine/serine dehydratase [Ferrimicrobium acidiphilum]KJE77037.1 phenylserine dehydratase [Ferrimicrobium acidiphilum DSM 19497]MCL5054052.1 threonine/serine dehydratase [Gammaproteobacteria bacterium]